MSREPSAKHAILRSFESLIKAMDPGAEERQAQQPQQQPAEPRIIVETGVVLGRKWRLYSDGAFEGETVRGMEAFRDLDHFKSFMEVSPALRNERVAGDLEEAAAEPISAAAATPIDTISAGNVAAAATADRDAVHPKPVRSHAEARLARELVMGGALGLVLCVAWWCRFYLLGDLHVELLRRGLSENVIRSANLSLRHSLSCFFLNTESCMAMKNWGRFAGYLVYEPLFVWAAIAVLGLGFLLIHVHNRKANDRTVEA
jgi:hypothetical protein